MIIQSKNVWINESFTPCNIEIENNRITNLLPYGTKADIDYGEAIIVPGFIDIHTHGAYGFDVNSASYEGLINWLTNAPKEGITTILPTTSTAYKEILIKALKNIANVKDSYDSGANIAGVHLEGPFINKDYRGAQKEEAIIAPDINEFIEFNNACNNLIKVVTIAPELDDNHNLIKYISSNNIVASIGHTSSTFEEGLSAINDGASSITHTFNAQTKFTHRNLGIAGLALYKEDLYSEIICDLAHVSKEALKIFFTCKDKDHPIMISDSLLCKGQGPKDTFLFSDKEIRIAEDTTARFIDNDVIAGSTMKMNVGLYNLIEVVNIPLDKAINSCTINPARLLNLDNIGLIKQNFYADITVLDKNYEVIQTYIKGRPSLP